MKLKRAYSEFVDFLYAISSIYVTNNDCIKLNDFNGREVNAFKKLVLEKENWRMKSLALSIKELLLIFTLSTIHLDNSFHFSTFDSSIEKLDSDFEIYKRLFIRFFDEQFKINIDTNEYKNILTTLNFRDETVWFLSNLIEFSSFFKFFLLELYVEMYELYIKSGLKNTNLERATGWIKIRDYSSQTNEVGMLFFLQNTYFNKRDILRSSSKEIVIISNDLSPNKDEIENCDSTENVRLFLKILSDPTKRKILVNLSKKTQYVDEIAKNMGFSKATISHHLSMLTNENLVIRKRKGKKIFFSLHYEVILRLLNDFENLFS